MKHIAIAFYVTGMFYIVPAIYHHEHSIALAAVIGLIWPAELAIKEANQIENNGVILALQPNERHSP